MRDSSGLHQKIQGMCDCYATNDPLREMSALKDIENDHEAAVKWAALAVLHGLNSNAEEISIEKSGNGKVRVTAEYRTSELPNPKAGVSDEVLKAFKDILHIDGPRGESSLAFGFRDNNFDLKVQTCEEGSDHKVTIRFP